MYIMFSKTMEFCNKVMVRADPPPPQLWSKTIKLPFFLGGDPSLMGFVCNITVNH